MGIAEDLLNYIDVNYADDVTAIHGGWVEMLDLKGNSFFFFQKDMYVFISISLDLKILRINKGR